VRPDKAQVLWENRTVPVMGGKLTDTFAPSAVHVYRIEDPVNYIAHQGEEAIAPSHSKAAYRIAAEHRLDYLKLDLRETRDGHVVLQHDGTLAAIMKWNVKISDLSLAEIRAKGRCIPRGGYTNETIVTLPEAPEIAKGMRKGIWLDFKHYTPKFAEKVFRTVDEAGVPMERVIVATFTKDALRWVQKNRPQVRRVAHTFIRKVKGGFQMNAGNLRKIYPTTESVVEGLVSHAKDYGLYGFNVPSIFRKGRQLYHTPPHIVRDLQKAGYWISIWFAYDPGTAEYYREVGADAFVTNWKERTFPEFQQHRERWAHLMRLLAMVPEKIGDAGSKRRNEALHFCTWEPHLASEAIQASGKWPATPKDVIDILETSSWTMPPEREPSK
jgi:glycerophosphoryl diester phosphodiesterase